MLHLSRLAIVAVLLAGSQSAVAGDPSLLRPYQFVAPQQPLTPIEQQKALIYQSQVDSQLRRLDHQNTMGQLDSFDQRLLLDTRSELQRMNGVLGY